MQGDSPNRKRFPWGKLLLACGVPAIAYAAYVHQSNKIDPPIVPGWNELVPCSYVVSFDGSKELLLWENHRATLYDKSPLKDGKRSKDIALNGTWSFDAGSKKYSLTAGELSDVYTLLSAGQISTCILIKGDLESANLRESWFAADEPPDDDR